MGTCCSGVILPSLFLLINTTITPINRASSAVSSRVMRNVSPIARPRSLLSFESHSTDELSSSVKERYS